jgi:hypothetical protein
MSDTFRKEYKPLSESQKLMMEVFKELAQELHNNYCDYVGDKDPRYIALAKTALEESVMWAIKAIT